MALARLDPSRIASSFARARVWSLGALANPAGPACCSCWSATPWHCRSMASIWRAGRVGGEATLGRPPVWSLHGLAGTLRFAAEEIWRTASLEPALDRRRRHGRGDPRACCSAGPPAVREIWNLIAMATLCLTLAAPGPVAGMAL